MGKGRRIAFTEEKNKELVEWAIERSRVLPEYQGKLEYTSIAQLICEELKIEEYSPYYPRRDKATRDLIEEENRARNHYSEEHLRERRERERRIADSESFMTYLRLNGNDVNQAWMAREEDIQELLIDSQRDCKRIKELEAKIKENLRENAQKIALETIEKLQKEIEILQRLVSETEARANRYRQQLEQLYEMAILQVESKENDICDYPASKEAEKMSYISDLEVEDAFEAHRQKYEKKKKKDNRGK